MTATRSAERTSVPGDDQVPEETFTISELAAEFEITSRSIRFYEDKGLLQPRRAGLNRIYSRRDRARLNIILRGKRLGFSLAEIKEMFALYQVGDGRVEQLKFTHERLLDRLRALARQRQDIDTVTGEIEDIRRQVEQMLAEKGIKPDGL